MPITLNGTNGITNVNGSAAAPAITGTDTDSGMYFATNSVALSAAGTSILGLSYNGSAARIQADWSQGTFSNRTAIQTSTVNSGTIVNFIPNGTGVGSVIDMYDKDDLVTNSTRFRFGINASECYISENVQGTGSYLPLNIYNNGAVQASISTAGLFAFNSGYGSVATAYGCRAWVNFNGTGTVAIRASGNVTSITDNGTGNYTVNFTTAMPDANYSAVTQAGNADATLYWANGATSTAPTVSAYRFATGYGSVVDLSHISCAIFR